ncbi:hypothetical protein PWT90_07390 [Aphanocladium album]|nr:hypothetical protein PWT90_07390 [Aphanocladium album]
MRVNGRDVELYKQKERPVLEWLRKRYRISTVNGYCDAVAQLAASEKISQNIYNAFLYAIRCRQGVSNFVRRNQLRQSTTKSYDQHVHFIKVETHIAAALLAGNHISIDDQFASEATTRSGSRFHLLSEMPIEADGSTIFSDISGRDVAGVVGDRGTIVRQQFRRKENKIMYAYFEKILAIRQTVQLYWERYQRRGPEYFIVASYMTELAFEKICLIDVDFMEEFGSISHSEITDRVTEHLLAAMRDSNNAQIKGTEQANTQHLPELEDFVLLPMRCQLDRIKAGPPQDEEGKFLHQLILDARSSAKRDAHAHACVDTLTRRLMEDPDDCGFGMAAMLQIISDARAARSKWDEVSVKLARMSGSCPDCTHDETDYLESFNPISKGLRLLILLTTHTEIILQKDKDDIFSTMHLYNMLLCKDDKHAGDETLSQGMKRLENCIFLKTTPQTNFLSNFLLAQGIPASKARKRKPSHQLARQLFLARQKSWSTEEQPNSGSHPLGKRNVNNPLPKVLNAFPLLSQARQNLQGAQTCPLLRVHTGEKSNDYTAWAEHAAATIEWEAQSVCFNFKWFCKFCRAFMDFFFSMAGGFRSGTRNAQLDAESLLFLVMKHLNDESARVIGEVLNCSIDLLNYLMADECTNATAASQGQPSG